MDPSCAPAPIRRYRNVAEMMAEFPQTQLHYEDHGVLLLEDAGIRYDRDFIAGLAFPPQWKKIGTHNGITGTPLWIRDGKWARSDNPLCEALPDNVMLMKVFSEFLRIEMEFKLLIHRVLPCYWNAEWANCTFRLTKTENEAAHLDSFFGGRALEARDRVPKIKFFLNVDTVPRVWNVGPNLPSLLRASAGALGSPLPTDVNVLCALINESGIYDRLPKERIEIPPGGVVFANGVTVLHQVLYGHRMVALEGTVPRASLHERSRCEWDAVRGWIEDAGYSARELEPVAS